MAKAKESAKDPQDLEVRIYSLATMVNESIIFLEELTGNRLLPIWIGISESQAIAIRFSGIVLPRPLTHDLLVSTIKTLGYSVDKTVISDIKENTFYARIHIHKGSSAVTLDARPSDAIAVAVRVGCPIYVDSGVFDRCQTLAKPITEDEVGKFKEELKNLKPGDIFKDLEKKKSSEGGNPPPQSEEPLE